MITRQRKRHKPYLYKYFKHLPAGFEDPEAICLLLACRTLGYYFFPGIYHTRGLPPAKQN